jgi:hypothetical protein
MFFGYAKHRAMVPSVHSIRRRRNKCWSPACGHARRYRVNLAFGHLPQSQTSFHQKSQRPDMTDASSRSGLITSKREQQLTNLLAIARMFLSRDESDAFVAENTETDLPC